MTDTYNDAIDRVDPELESLRGRPVSDRVKVKRRPARANYQKHVIHEIFDEALVCHVAFVVDGQPHILPQLHVRIDDTIYLHGDSRNGMLGHLASGDPLAIEV